ncbi:beta-lactamase superfamily II metal-dependent hydrolase [Lewinella aquimaris]|uniref:Beta-lactamase superfamily II metal-dependent hydrolase n=1 Tax=Neolewinella aquimaris TaxID=1835722 RepID=A0A840ED22_9BACT|nr:MBL fold metallo-hydrolase [Neolewinella aquimaris]MBB4078846.1 beta-lactamase superfamily II metal-dependent hydrolase [Neolewinella aquimaris]
MAHTYVDLGENGSSVYLYAFDPGEGQFKRARQVLWGDWLRLADHRRHPAVGPEWLAINWAPRTEDRILYIPREHTTDRRPLEIIFLDVGQGDGAVLITPERDADEKIVVIDAGDSSHMRAFLDGRFRAYRGFQFEAAIMTHPDTDHYRGFRTIFSDSRIGFNTVYHNGLVERPTGSGYDKVGGLTEDPPGSGQYYIEDLAVDRADILRHFDNASTFGNYRFAPIMHSALHNPLIGDIRMLSTDSAHSIHVDGRAYLPEFAPRPDRPYSIEVLGPVVEFGASNLPRLRRISSNYNKTKNGHSIILRLHFGKYRILFGGDLNVPAEKYLLSRYAGLPAFPRRGTPDYDRMMEETPHWFRAEVLKVCHHGSEKVTDEFLDVVHPACFVISSGDQEGHVHPRPDLLGRLGKAGRGAAPVILATELQRSTRELEDPANVKELNDEIDVLAREGGSADLLRSIRERIRKLARTNVDVYGAIYLKTDGERLITAFKLEELSDKKKWFYYEYVIDEAGELELR